MAAGPVTALLRPPSLTMDDATLHKKNWRRLLAPYKRPSARAASIQLLDTALPFALLWYLMARSLDAATAQRPRHGSLGANVTRHLSEFP